MPQLTQLSLVYQSQWLWLLLVLAAIYLFVGRGILPRVEATVDGRDARIAADLAAAERLQGEATQTEEAWRARVNAAHGAGQSEIAKAKAAADAEAQARIAKADAEIAAKSDAAEAALATARASALAEVQGVAAEAVQAIVAKLAGGSVSAEDAAKAVAGVMA